MVPARDQRFPSGPGQRRTPPLLILAGAALVLICLLGVVALATRSSGDVRGTEAPSDADLGLQASVPPAGGSPTGGVGGHGVVHRASSAPTSAPGAAGSPSSEGQANRAENGDASPDEIPIWARVPPLVAMPYPEGGAYNPPLPPIQIPPGMLPAPSTDLPDGGG